MLDMALPGTLGPSVIEAGSSVSFAFGYLDGLGAFAPRVRALARTLGKACSVL
jgi:hypothetical protein